MKIDLTSFEKVRYIKLQPAPLKIIEVIGYKNGKQMDRSAWRASNLVRPYVKSYILQLTRLLS